MRNFGALVWREIFERRLLLLVSALLGLVPIIAPWVPGRPDRFTPEDMRTAALIALVPLFGGAALLILGSTIVGRDLSEGRLGFYFSRPISGWALWLSRLTAATALLVASLLLMAGPTAALQIDELRRALWESRPSRTLPVLGLGEIDPEVWISLPAAPSPLGFLAFALLTVVALLALTHTASTIVRGRSLWVLADLAGLGLFAALIWAGRNVLVREQALGALARSEHRLLPWILGALLLAGGVQITRGRTDLARGHRYLSSTLWPILIAGALLFGGYARFVVSSEVDDLERLFILEASPDHGWLLAGGPVRHRGGARAAFLLDTRSDRSWRLGDLGVVHSWKAFSGDSSALVWARCESLRPPACRVWTKDLRDPDIPPEGTEISLDVRPTSVALSDGGTRLAVATGAKVIVYEVASGRLLAAVETQDPTALMFLSRDRLRFYELHEADGSWGPRARQLDIPSRQLADAGPLPPGTHPSYEPEKDMVFHLRAVSGGFHLFDPGTGRPLLEGVVPWPRWQPGQSHFLADGRRVTSDHANGYLTLQVFSPGGEEPRRLERPGVTGLRFGGELDAGRLVLALREESWDGPAEMLEALAVEPLLGWTTYLLDTETLELTPLAAGLVPFRSARSVPRLYVAGGQAVIRFDPATGEHRRVLPALAAEWSSNFFSSEIRFDVGEEAAAQ